MVKRMILAKKGKPGILKILILVAVQLLIIGAALLAYSHFTKTTTRHQTLTTQKDRRAETAMEKMVKTLLPAIEAENKLIRQEKQRIESGSASEILALAEKYDVDMIEDEIPDRLYVLKARVDEIPPSLLIAYAWVATGYGQNKDAIKRNNYFDDRDWKISLEGEEESTYTLKQFASTKESVKAFMLKMNTAPFFEDFRRVRQTHRGYVGGKMIPSRLADKFVFYQGDSTLDRKIQKVMKEYMLESRVGEKQSGRKISEKKRGKSPPPKHRQRQRP